MIKSYLKFSPFSFFRIPTRQIQLPPLKAEKGLKIKLDIGDFAIKNHVFHLEDNLKFAKILDDDCPLHYDAEYVKKYTKFDGIIIYGMMGGGLWTPMFREHLPGSIYISQTYNFRRPIYLDEEVKKYFNIIFFKVESKVEVEEINKEKKYVTFKTTVLKKQKNEVATDGKAIIWIPNLEI